MAGPLGFLLVSFTMATLRPEAIRVQGWASWPSSMALGGPPAAIPQILAFLWLGACYAVFAWGALRPALGSRLTTGAFLAIAAFDVCLAFPTDAPGADPSWHGTLHLIGVLGATIATLVGAAASVRATRDRPGWRPWRAAAGILFAAAGVGLVAGFDEGWAKVLYVLGITLPVVVLALSVRRELRRQEGSVVT